MCASCELVRFHIVLTPVLVFFFICIAKYEFVPLGMGDSQGYFRSWRKHVTMILTPFFIFMLSSAFYEGYLDRCYQGKPMWSVLRAILLKILLCLFTYGFGHVINASYYAVETGRLARVSR